MKRIDSPYGLWLLSVVWPFLGFLLAVRNGINRNTTPVILFFAFLYGYSIFLFGGDILHYRDSYAYVVEYTWSDYFHLITHSLDPEGDKGYIPHVVIQKPDVFALTLQFFTSRITDNPRWFWGILSVIYTWLILVFVKEVFALAPRPRYYWYQTVFVVALLTVVPFYVGVTGVRFWPALFLFMIFLMRYVRTGNIVNAILSATSLLVHYSFVFPVAIFILGALLRFNKKVSYALVIASALVFGLANTTSTFQFLQEWATVFDDTSLETNVSGYVDEDIYQMRKEEASDRNWYVQGSSDALLFFLLISVGLEIVGLVKLEETGITRRIFPIMLCFFAVTLLAFNLGSFARFKNIFYLLAIARYIIIFSEHPQSRYLRITSIAFIPILVLYIIVSLRTGFYSVDPLLLAANPLTVFYAESERNLSQLLVGH